MQSYKEAEGAGGFHPARELQRLAGIQALHTDFVCKLVPGRRKIRKGWNEKGRQRVQH